MRISDWSSDVCEGSRSNVYIRNDDGAWLTPPISCGLLPGVQRQALLDEGLVREAVLSRSDFQNAPVLRVSNALRGRSEEHTSELQSLMRISYAVCCLKKKTHR